LPFSFDFDKFDGRPLSHKKYRVEKNVYDNLIVGYTTHYLEVFYKVQSTTLSSRTLDVVPGERIQFDQVLAPGLIS